MYFSFLEYGLICMRVGCCENMETMGDVIFYWNMMSKQILKLKVCVNFLN